MPLDDSLNKILFPDNATISMLTTSTPKPLSSSLSMDAAAAHMPSPFPNATSFVDEQPAPLPSSTSNYTTIMTTPESLPTTSSSTTTTTTTTMAAPTTPTTTMPAPTTTTTTMPAPSPLETLAPPSPSLPSSLAKMVEQPAPLPIQDTNVIITTESLLSDEPNIEQRPIIPLAPMTTTTTTAEPERQAKPQEPQQQEEDELVVMPDADEFVKIMNKIFKLNMTNEFATDGESAVVLPDEDEKKNNSDDNISVMKHVQSFFANVASADLRNLSFIAAGLIVFSVLHIFGIILGVLHCKWARNKLFKSQWYDFQPKAK